MLRLAWLSIFATGCSLYFSDPQVAPDSTQPDAGARPDGTPPPPPDGDHAAMCGDGVRAPSEVCFGAPITLAIGAPVYSARLLDVTEDGQLDLVYLSQGHIVIRDGSATGAFGAPHEGPAVDAWWLASGDLDADGDVDLATAGRDTLTAWTNAGGTFTKAAELATTPSIGLAVGNVDGYPGDELVFAGPSEYLVRWLDGNELRYLYSTSLASAALGVADIDDDGHIDGLVTGTEYGTVMGGGVGGVQYVHSYGVAGAGSRVTAMSGGDVDGDGETDLVMASVDPGVLTFISDGSYNTSPEVNGSPRFLAVAELDGIAGAEIVVGMPATRELRVVSRMPYWIVRPAIELPQLMTSMYFDGDVNHDDVTDLVITLEDQILVLPSARP